MAKARNYKKLGLDQTTTAIATAVTTAAKANPTTGDISSGDFVTVTKGTQKDISAPVKARRTGAILISSEEEGGPWAVSWRIGGSTLSVLSNAGKGATYTFWVF